MATTLEQLGFTVIGGSSVLIVTLGLFGCAVHSRSSLIAPRATARPPNTIYNAQAAVTSQKTGDPVFGWITWTLGLSYDTLLNGVPGTGTRQQGLSGSLLRVNLDGIVLLRFHAVCLRVTVLACILFGCVLIPCYYSAQCFNDDCVENDAYNLTNYQRTTLANVPNLESDSAKFTIVHPRFDGLLWRLYATVLCFGIVVSYFCHELHAEWVQILAMRRVYYLEHDLWGERQEELQQTMVLSNDPSSKPSSERHLHERDPWIPHPEQRETVPNIALYSILVGGLPSLPNQAADAINVNSTVLFSQRESIDWQLSLTTTFFDHCVPNQPGFSSSVAAVTIIPGALDLSNAWRKWYAAASKLRYLRYIRRQIAQKRHFDLEELYDPDEIAKYGYGDNDDDGVLYVPQNASEKEVSELLDSPPAHQASPCDNDPPLHQNYYQNAVADDDDSYLYETMEFGPEQAAVYAREFAQSAAPCCPNGTCHEGRIRRLRIDQLLELEKKVSMDVHAANLELRAARRRATRADSTPNLPPLSPESNGSPHTMANKLHQPIKDRYDRQASNQKMASEPVQTRLTADRLGQISDDTLGLEAQLYRKQGEQTNSTRRDDSNKPKRHRKSPSLEGIAIPGDISLEVQLIKDHSNSSTTYPKPRNHVTIDTSPTHLDNIAEQESSGNSLPPGNDKEEEEEPDLESGFEGSTQWLQVETIVTEAQADGKEHPSSTRRVSTGQWEWPTFRWFFRQTRGHTKELQKWAQQQSKDAVENLARESTYAVVTFTSRQAAVAARSCLADGRGAGRWMTLNEMPIPPLADAAPADLCTCRNCCRPVTLSIPERQKNCRNYITIALLATIYTFYTIPLAAAASLIDPDQLDSFLFPNSNKIEDGERLRIVTLLSGLLNAMIWSIFFALCPMVFKCIANFGSKSTSVASAEFKALQYYWWFMLLTAFSGGFLSQIGLKIFRTGFKVAGDFQSILIEIGSLVPSNLSVSWLSWIILRVTVVLPLQYLLQINTFLFSAFGLNCCSRAVRGGGPGGAVPYRIYVDSGVVMMCVLALAPASPLVAVGAVFYFLLCQPLWRRNLIFMYRPKFDGGGFRFPFIFDMCISSTVVAEILLTVQMALKQAAGPTIFSALIIFPTITFSRNMKEKFLRSFEDAALLQTSLLDGWDTSTDYPVEKREEFRKFLVDAHKAAYVPVCLAGSDTDEFLTAEPAIVVPTEIEEISPTESGDQSQGFSQTSASQQSTVNPLRGFRERKKTQHGITLRRAVNTLQAMRRRTSSVDSEFLDHCDESGVSPFEKSMSSRSIFSHHQPHGESFRNRHTSISSLGDSDQRDMMIHRRRTFSERTLGSRNSSVAGETSNPNDHSWKSLRSTKNELSEVSASKIAEELDIKYE